MPMFKVYLGNLDLKVTAEILKPLFEPFGDGEEIVIATDAEGKSRGFAIILFKDPLKGQLAIETLTDRKILGRTVVINEAIKKGKKTQPVVRAPRNSPLGPRAFPRGGFGGRPGPGGASNRPGGSRFMRNPRRLFTQAGGPGGMGAPGAPGAPGTPGAPGAPGASGTASAPGASAAPSTSGASPAPGVPGAPGAPGTPGAPSSRPVPPVRPGTGASPASSRPPARPAARPASPQAPSRPAGTTPGGTAGSSGAPTPPAEPPAQPARPRAVKKTFPPQTP